METLIKLKTMAGRRLSGFTGYTWRRGSGRAL